MTGLYYGIILRDKITESYYGIILRNHTTEWYYEIILQDHLYERIPGMPGTSPEPPGIPRGPWACPWDPQGRDKTLQGRRWDPLARAWDPWGRPWDPQVLLSTTKTLVSHPIYSARSSRLLCLNLLVGAHRMKHLTGPFCPWKAAKIKQIGWGPSDGGGGLPIVPQGQAPT